MWKFLQGEGKAIPGTMFIPEYAYKSFFMKKVLTFDSFTQFCRINVYILFLNEYIFDSSFSVFVTLNSPLDLKNFRHAWRLAKSQKKALCKSLTQCSILLEVEHM